MTEVKNHFAPNPNIISQLVELGMKGEQGKRLVQSYYNNPPAWMTPSEARLYVPLAAERLGRIEQQVQKIAAPQTTVAEDRIAGLAGIQPQQAPMQQQAQPEQQVQEGGVADLPVPDSMFQEQSMAGGGIVAFDDGGEVPRFANRGLVALNVPQLQSNLQFLMQQYDTVPEGTPLKAQLAEQIQQIEGQLNPTTAEDVTQATEKSAVLPAKKAQAPLAGLQEANAEVDSAKRGIAGLMSKFELSPEEVASRSDEYMRERTAAGQDFRTKAEEVMGKQEARVGEIGKNANLRTALNFFTNLAASKSPYFATAAGEAGGKALEYYEAMEEKKQRAQAALESSQINYNLARAAEARGDLDARDRFVREARADQRAAVTAQITGLKAAGELANDQAKNILKLRELGIREITAKSAATTAAAAQYRALNPPQKIMWDTIQSKIESANKNGEYGEKKLTTPQIMALTARTFAEMHGQGGVGGDKLNTLRGDVAKEVSKNINAKVPGQDPRYQQIRDLQAAGKTEEANKIRNKIQEELFESRTTGLGYSGPGSLFGKDDATADINPLGLNLPPLSEEQ